MLMESPRKKRVLGIAMLIRAVMRWQVDPTVCYGAWAIRDCIPLDWFSTPLHGI
jgi:hypothetical protein